MAVSNMKALQEYRWLVALLPLENLTKSLCAKVLALAAKSRAAKHDDLAQICEGWTDCVQKLASSLESEALRLRHVLLKNRSWVTEWIASIKDHLQGIAPGAMSAISGVSEDEEATLGVLPRTLLVKIMQEDKVSEWWTPALSSPEVFNSIVQELAAKLANDPAWRIDLPHCEENYIWYLLAVDAWAWRLCAQHRRCRDLDASIKKWVSSDAGGAFIVQAEDASSVPCIEDLFLLEGLSYVASTTIEDAPFSKLAQQLFNAVDVFGKFLVTTYWQRRSA